MLKTIYTCIIFFTTFHISLSQVNDRVVAVNDYYNTYLDTEIRSDILSWTGNIPTCNPGSVSANVIDKLLSRINYYRRLVGVEDAITFSNALNAKCQQAALMMDANNSLSHSPPSNWSCFSQDGQEAAGASNLHLGNIDFFNPIDNYMEDSGSSNYTVGHRRWILFSKAKTFGIGQTLRANALWVFGNNTNPSIFNNFIAFPPAGFIPNNLVPDRWSFSVPDADFSNATVQVKLANTNINLTIVSRSDTGFGDNTIVWEPTGINTTSADDVFYTVDVNNVLMSDGTIQNFNYETKFFNTSIKGDVNVDGVRNVFDAVLISKYTVDLFVSGDCKYLDRSTEICLDHADADGNGTINVFDAVVVSQCVAMVPNVLCPN